jgi:predicted nucleic acid-binding OB-fold protein
MKRIISFKLKRRKKKRFSSFKDLLKPLSLLEVHMQTSYRMNPLI